MTRILHLQVVLHLQVATLRKCSYFLSNTRIIEIVVSQNLRTGVRQLKSYNFNGSVTFKLRTIVK